MATRLTDDTTLRVHRGARLVTTLDAGTDLTGRALTCQLYDQDGQAVGGGSALDGVAGTTATLTIDENATGGLDPLARYTYRVRTDTLVVVAEGLLLVLR